MNYDKYPPLPKAPDFPNWKDTPEREALHLELEKKKFDLFSKNGCLTYLAMYIVAVIITNCIFSGATRRGINWLMIAFVAFFISGYVLAIWCLIVAIFRSIGLRRKYGFCFFSLQRPSIKAEVAQILEVRLDFEEELFCSYWRDEEHAQMALKIINLVHEMLDFPNKMIYPNDSLMLLFEHSILPDVDIDDCYWVRVFYEVTLHEDDKNNILFDYDNSFAEFVEVCVGNNKNSEQ